MQSRFGWKDKKETEVKHKPRLLGGRSFYTDSKFTVGAVLGEVKRGIWQKP